MSKEDTTTNIYQLDGRVPLVKAVPFGLQHIMAMLVVAIILNLILPKNMEVAGETEGSESISENS